MAAPRILGSGGAVRLKLLVEAFLFILVLSGISAIILSREWIQLHQEFGKLVPLFGSFLLLSITSLATGFLRNNPTNYVLGDFYKFTVPILAVSVIYAGVNSSHPIERAFSVIHRIYMLLLGGVLFLYITGILQPNQRPGFIYQLPIMLVVSYWLYRNSDPVAKFGCPFLAIASVPVIFYSQSLSLILQLGLTAVLAVIFYHTEESSKVGFWTILLGILGLLGFVAFWIIATQIPVYQWEQYGYLGHKVTALVGEYSFYERLILLGGSRAAEPIGILARINNSTFELLFGAGMGGTFVATSPFPDSTWVGADHFVHAGFWETVLRTGVLGGVAYLAVIVTYLYVGWRISSDSYLGAATAAHAAVTLIMLPLTGTILGTQFFPVTLFAYGLIRLGERRSD